MCFAHVLLGKIAHHCLYASSLSQYLDIWFDVLLPSQVEYMDYLSIYPFFIYHFVLPNKCHFFSQTQSCIKHVFVWSWIRNPGVSVCQDLLKFRSNWDQVWNMPRKTRRDWAHSLKEKSKKNNNNNKKWPTIAVVNFKHKVVMKLNGLWRLCCLKAESFVCGYLWRCTVKHYSFILDLFFLLSVGYWARSHIKGRCNRVPSRIHTHIWEHDTHNNLHSCISLH